MIQAFWSGSVATFLATPASDIMGILACAQIRHFRTNEVQQMRAWEATIALLRDALSAQPDSSDWWVLLEYPMLRLGRRADVIILAGRAIFVLEIKAGARSITPADREQAEDYAIDLRDFHEACRLHPIVPILVATDAIAGPIDWPLPLACVTPVLDASAASLPGLLGALHASMPEPRVPLDAVSWLAAPYRPVPTIVEAACMLYARHGVAEIKAARADTSNLSTTTDAILAEIAEAREENRHIAIFVTGIPGAGKTLCGLNAAFGAGDAGSATFLTGNPTLVHVLREALAQDAIESGADRRAARQQMESAIQALPRFRNHYVAAPIEIPAEQIVVVDEAQRCWSRAHAIAKTRDKAVRLTLSEPGHLLEIMGRHPGFAALICLIGGGQEIHDGEGGLAEWGAALRSAGDWQVRAAPGALSTADPRQRLGALPGLVASEALHLDVSVRQIRSAAAASWVDHVLEGDSTQAATVAREAGGVPFLLTRSLAAMRARLAASSRGLRRCGLLASSGAKRLRAEGLGAELPHMDASAVAHWFLDRYPRDVRASNALEVVATEFSCQGLELDHVGLCWDADLIRERGRAAWRARDFRGSRWTIPTGAEAIANQLNTYRVLLTRARYETVIFVPRGDAADPTRSPAIYDAIADFLLACGAGPIPAREPEPEPVHRDADLFALS